jgi:hypothetical protein
MQGVQPKVIEGQIGEPTANAMHKEDVNDGLQSSSPPIHAFEAFNQQMASFPVDMADVFVGDDHTIPQVLNCRFRPRPGDVFRTTKSQPCVVVTLSSRHSCHVNISFNSSCQHKSNGGVMHPSHRLFALFLAFLMVNNSTYN